jgi:glucose-6-phosphate isomerase
MKRLAESPMALKQSIENARAERIGPEGVSAATFADALARTNDALTALRKRHADGTLPLLKLPEKRDDIAAIKAAAARLTAASATDVVFLGTGGSSLGGQTLAQLARYGVPGAGVLDSGPRLHFMDNLDGDTFGAVLRLIPLATARFVVISKSGGTGETLMQCIAVLSALKKAGLGALIPELVFGLTEPAKANKRNGLRDLLTAHRVTMLDHDPGVGGRYSALTNVGLLPAAVVNRNIEKIRAGAAAALAPILDGSAPQNVPAAVGAALNVALAQNRKSISVMMAYADKLELFTRWYVQLWAESLGKDGKGTTPLAALGPVDQHSQLQLFIAGPRDKLFTIITEGSGKGGPRIDGELAKLAGEPDFADKSMGELVAAQGRATAETLAKNGCPVRSIHIDQLDEASLGELLMHFMLETIIAAHLLRVDPFDQPAVEEGKVLAKKHLAGA